MRGLVLGVAVLALAGCGQAREASDAPEAMADSAVPSEPSMRAPTGIGVTAAPGVAFSYQYAFRLQPARIAAAQEAHAQACEKLGIARCRITGMRYRLLGENNVEAMLAFKLDPAIARVFGRNAIAQVEAAKGTLVEAAISGADAGAEIDRLNTDRADAAERLRRIDADLARAGLRSTERAELQNQRAQLEREIAAVRTGVAEQRASLATTPMVFDYGSGRSIRGFDSSAPLTGALDTAIASAQTTLAVLLGILAIFGPPALLLLAVWLLWRRFGRLLPGRRRDRAGDAT